MKTIDIRRHAEKDGQLTSKKGRLAAKELGSYNAYDYLVAGLLPRTWETLAAFMQEMPNLSDAEVLASIRAFGNEELFASWAIMGLPVAAKDCGDSYFEGLRKILDANDFRRAQIDALNGLRQVFDQMAYNTEAAAFGHSPVIELAASAVDPDFVDPKLGSLDGLRFCQTDEGCITVEIIPPRDSEALKQ